MLLPDATPEQMDAAIAQNGLVFVDFWADWCAPCKQFSVIYDAVAADYTAFIFLTMDIKKHPTIAETLEVRSIPQLMIFKFGALIFSESGSMPASRFRALVEQAQQIKKDQIVQQDS